MAKIHVEFHCEACGAEGDGFRDESEMDLEECWKCGQRRYVATPTAPATE